MRWLMIAALTLTGISGLLVVLCRDPGRQVLALAGNGLVLSVLFFVLQAPDVALSELAVNTVITPLLFLVALASASMNAGQQ
jgi:energy-converting hydrogenase B subunit D